MCGIYVTNIPFKQKEIETKLKCISFRGPDNTGIKKIGNIVLGHLRLAILDLEERSNQPMALDNHHIVFNGEIYNYGAVKDELVALGYQFKTTSDTEVILIGYKQWGSEVVTKLNGMFAFCIYDALAQKIFCARDRLGVKPFYYYWKDGEFEICSQVAPLRENKRISREAVSIFLDCGYIPSPYSIFQDVYKLPPGNTMTIDLVKNELKKEEYWNLKTAVERNISYEEAKKQLHELLIDSVKIRLQSDVPIGAFLSGGIDSALVAALASKVCDKPINTFTIGFTDPKYDESNVAARYAKIIGSNHTETFCSPEDVLQLVSKLVKVYDEPFADSSALPSLLLNSVTKRHVTVALSGDGGDESFLGYNHFESVNKFIVLTKIPTTLRKIFSKLVRMTFIRNRYPYLKEIFKIETIDDFIEAIFIGYSSLQKARNVGWLHNYSSCKNLSVSPIQKAADLNIKLWLENDSNVKVDRASMAYSVEVRSPFLDYRIVEFARTLPVSFRFEKGRRKKILRDILKEYIPEEVFSQPKKGFSVPLGKWISNELKHEVISNLNDEFLRTVPNLNVSRFTSMLQEHLEGKSDHSAYIWRVYIYSKWCRESGFYKEASAKIKAIVDEA